MNGDSRAGAVLYAKELERVAAFYSAVLGFATTGRDEDHVVLESREFQLVILRTPSRIASTIHIAVPPVRRANSAVKLVFFVPSIAAVRIPAASHGGVVDWADEKWMFDGWKVCDGLDPERNVVQFREHLGPARQGTI